MNPLLPIAVAAGVLFFFGKRKPKGKLPEDNALGPATGPALEPAPPQNGGYGDLFVEGSLPNVIESSPGDVFTVRLSSNPSTGYFWRLASTPPGNELEQLFMSSDGSERPGNPSNTEVVQSDIPGGGDALQYFIFEVKKSGSGSIVFHLDPPGAGLPPEEVVEIKVEIRDN